MKLTTTKLKQLIEEEYQKLNTEADEKKRSVADAQRTMLQLRDRINDSGITDVERDIVLDFMEIAINFSKASDMNKSDILTPLNIAVKKMRQYVGEPE